MGEKPCESCREATRARNREDVRRFRLNRGSDALAQQRAYRHALNALRDEHPDDFNRLYAIERALEGLTAEPGPRGGFGTKNRRFD
jgi:hypothetical protein